jgi:hypothetical protein
MTTPKLKGRPTRAALPSLVRRIEPCATIARPVHLPAV